MSVRSIAHYEILEKLGEGGMGVVYKARDTRLNRNVALKLLPAEKFGDEERIRRLAQEARAASSLNHPNIITIHDIGAEDGVPYLVMEYVAGKTLDELIPRKGMRISEVFKIAVQVADALTAAAAAGVIHRDIKPGNVMVTDSGLVKVLDFSLAKFATPAAAVEGATATVVKTADAERPRTREGTVLGTVCYMSPEQAEGKPLDSRSDIFSFGATLYEMTTGQHAFRGETSMSTISAILRDDPRPVTQIVADVPSELERIISRCLRKDPDRRFQHMSDVRVALLELKEESDSGRLRPVAAARQTAGRRWMYGAAALLVAAAGIGFPLRSRFASPAPDPSLRAVPITSYSGAQGAPSFSPDGNQIAFPWTGDQGKVTHIYVKIIGNDTPLRLTSSSLPDESPAWAPDGKSIAFVRRAGAVDAICQVSPIGGPERRIAEVVAGPSPRITWSHDGKWLVTSGRQAPETPSRILVISAATGDVRALSFGDNHDEYSPALSTDSRSIAFTRMTGDHVSGLFVADLSDQLQATGKATRLSTPNGQVYDKAWTPDGKSIVFLNSNGSSNSLLWRISPSASALPQPLPLSMDGVRFLAFSLNGSRLAVERGFTDVNVWRVPITGPGKTGPPATFIDSPRMDRIREHAYSPDLRSIAFETNRTGPYSVWLANDDGSNPRMLFEDKQMLSGSPAWSPDGRRIAFDTRKDGNPEIYVISVDGGAPRRLTNHPADDVLPCWSHDGKWIYFSSNRTGRFEVFRMPSEGGDAVQLTRNGGWGVEESPDGAFLYYTRLNLNLPVSASLFTGEKSPLLRLPTRGGVETEVIGQVFERAWSVTGQGVWFLWPTGPEGGELRFLDFATGQVHTAASTSKPLQQSLSISPDNRWALYTQVDHDGTEILLVENFH
jgi:serine/threonine protein kinase/Tol biopolymer transport system component